MIEKPARIEFLKRSHLFSGLSDTDLAAVADALQEKTFEEPGAVFSEGAPADSMDIIFQGKVTLSRHVNEKPVKGASLVKADYFGEQGLRRNRKRDMSATAESGTILLSLTRAKYISLLKTIPTLRQNINIMIACRQLAQELNYQWLSENEVVYFLSRKHQFLLIRAFIVPVFLLFPILGLLVFAYLLSSATLGLLGGFSLVANLAWGFWSFVDWGNDYYIVTNQRVIWLEKVVGFYDSRTEAPLGTILSVNTETDYFGRIYDYGIVIVRTYTGQIRMNYVRHPKQAAAMIEEHMGRTKESVRTADEETMKQAIRAKLGFNKPPVPGTAVAPAPLPAKPVKLVKKQSALSTWWQNAFRMRTVDGNTITYHKHILGFIRDAAPYALGILALICVVAAWPFFFKSGVPLSFGTIITFLVIVLIGGIVYQYIDWADDIYQVTPEEIIDIYRKPLGTEDRRAAALENILSTEYKRRGLLGILFNFGTVYIMVGTEQYDFEDVLDPPTVQQDIIRRQQGRLQKKREMDTAAERERMADWLAMYHRTLEETKKDKDQSETPVSE